jgi:hypothetical protein
MPKASSLAASKTRKAKGGALTRRQRTTALRRRSGYSTIALVPNGLRITCRESDGYVNLAEIFAAEADARGGKPKELRRWLALKSTPGYLEAVAKAEGLTAGNPADSHIEQGGLDRQNCRSSLIEQGTGSADTWAHPQVACEVAGWLSPPLRLAINRLWLDTVNASKRRPRPLDAAGAATVRQRKDSNALLSQVAHERGCPPHMVHRQLTHALTGSAPEVWKAKLGEGWLDRTSVTFQAVQQFAAAVAANQISALPVESTKRHLLAACRTAAGVARSVFQVERVEPTLDGPAFSAKRLCRVLQG